jgi:hypothetical protein
MSHSQLEDAFDAILDWSRWLLPLAGAVSVVWWHCQIDAFLNAATGSVMACH